MTCFRLSALLTTFFLAAAPVLGQGTDVSGPTQGSDVSGSIVQQSDVGTFQSDATRIRMADIASSLSQALRDGAIGSGLVGQQPVVVPSSAADLLLASSRTAKRSSARQFRGVLTAEGISAPVAAALAESTAGLIQEGRTVDVNQFMEALGAFNAVVDEAPAPFLLNPPQEFVVIRTVLTALLDGTA